MDGDSIATVFARNDGAELEDDEKEAAGIGKFALRFTLIPVAVDKVALSAGIVPFSKAVLQEKMTAAGSNLSSPHCPTIAVKLLHVQQKSWNARPIRLCPTEEPGDRVGFGHLPLIEAMGHGEITHPESDLLEQEVVAFLRACNPTNNVAAARLPVLYDNPAGFLTGGLSGSISHEWPVYRGPVLAQPPRTATG